MFKTLTTVYIILFCDFITWLKCVLMICLQSERMMSYYNFLLRL